jgi:hypothetical protein
MHTDTSAQTTAPQPQPLRLVTETLIAQEARARDEQLARVAQRLVSDARSGITDVRVHCPGYDATFSQRGDGSVSEHHSAPRGRLGRQWAARLRTLWRSRP